MEPPSRLAECVECSWISETADAATHRILPDGCADIIYTRGEGRSTLRFVGPMTRYKDFTLPAATTSVGIRFRPAMWTGIVRLRGEEATDQLIALEDIWGKASSELLRRLNSTGDTGESARLMLEEIRPPDCLSGTQRAIQFLEHCSGLVAVDKLAKEAGLSERQFRRRCIEEAALTPKLLARILRFRKAQMLLPVESNRAGLAAACGYFDQSHLIAEFKTLSGRTPTSAPTVHRRTGRRAPEPECRSAGDRRRVEQRDE